MSIQVITITGASDGLGAALAMRYAAPDRVLCLCARNMTKLKKVAKACRDKGAKTIIAQIDVKNSKALEEWISKIEAQFQIDLAIANAGIFGGNGADQKLESSNCAKEQIRINLEGVINFVSAVVPYMRARKHGHIAIISSLAALHPHADAPAYSASKAGVAGYGAAMREFLMEDKITVSLVYPGHIDTQQTQNFRGWMPLMITPEGAADIIGRRLEKGRSFIAFPKLLLIGIWLNNFLPWRLRAFFNKPYRFYVD